MAEYNDLDEFGFQADNEDLNEFGFEEAPVYDSTEEAEPEFKYSNLLKYATPSMAAQELGKNIDANALLQGAKQGLTWSFGDEIGGGVQSSLDATQRLLNKFNLADKSPTQVSEEILEQGFQGDIGPTSSGELYKEGKAEELQQLQEARERAPGTTFAGEIMGGLIAPGGIAKTGSNLLGKAGIKELAAKGATMGAASGTAEAIGSDQDLTTTGLSALLGAGTGGLFGRLANKATIPEMEKTANKLREDANLSALRSLGAKNKDIRKEIDAEIKYGNPRESGIFALDENIIDISKRPKETAKQVQQIRKELQSGYEEALNTFDDGSMALDPQYAKELTSDIYEEIQEELPDTITDLVTPEMKRTLSSDASKLQQDMEAALSSNNPAKELQNLFVRYNDVAFKAGKVNSPTAEARKLIRNKIKAAQRELIERANPAIKDSLNELDSRYTNMLDLEELSLDAASQTTKIGMGDAIRGVTAEMTGIPGAGTAVTGASILSKKILDRDITDVSEGFSAIKKYNKYKKLQDLIAEGRSGSMANAGLPIAASTGSGISSAISENETPETTKEFTKNSNNYIDNVLQLSGQPEKEIFNVINSSPVYRKIYEENPEKLTKMAKMLSNAKSPQQKNAMRFKLLQDPDYRKMLQELNAK